jgi:hypothetical protein
MKICATNKFENTRIQWYERKDTVGRMGKKEKKE